MTLTFDPDISIANEATQKKYLYDKKINIGRSSKELYSYIVI